MVSISSFECIKTKNYDLLNYGLKSEKYSITELNSEDESLIDYATRLADLKSLNILLKYQMRELKFCIERLKSALIIALHEENLKIIKSLLEYNCKTNANFGNIICTELIKDIWDVVFQLDRVEIFRTLEEYHPNKNSNVTWMSFTLKNGSYNNSMLIVKYVIEKYGEQLFLLDDIGQSSFFGALVKCGNTYMFELLRNYAGQKVFYETDDNERTLLHCVIFEKNYFMTAKILHLNSIKYISIYNNAYDDDKRTVLHYIVCDKNNPSIKTLLYDNCPCVNRKDNYGNTALHLFIQHNDDNDIFKKLIDLKADLLLKNSHGQHALHLAAQKISKFYRIIIRSNPKCINDRDNKGKTPLDYAAENQHYKCLNLLLEYGADINILTSHVDKEYFNCDDFTNILSRAIIMRQVAGLYVNPKLLKNFKIENYSKFLNSCKTEITDLKNCNIFKNKSFYDFLIAEKHFLVIVADLTEFHEICTSKKIMQRFPIYYKILLKQYDVSKQFSPYYEQASCYLYLASQCRLSSMLLHKIMTQFDVNDMKSIVNAFEPKIHT